MYRLILLDDEQIVLDSIKKVFDFEEFGFSLEGMFSNPLKALEQLEDIAPHLIITDIKMPGLDGLEFTSKAKDLLPETEVVIMSGHGDFEYAQTAVRLGVSDYLLKPISKKMFSDMLGVVKKKLDEKQEQAEYVENLKKMVDAVYRGEDETKEEKKYSQNITSAVEYIKEHYSENISLGDVAAYTCLNKNYLADLFRKELDTTFVNYLTGIRIDQAKRYLKETDLKMYEISYSVGYSDYAYFSTLFKKHTGQTLSQFRKS